MEDIITKGLELLALIDIKALLSAIAGAAASGIIMLTKKTKTKIDDDFAKKVAEEIIEQSKDQE